MCFFFLFPLPLDRKSKKLAVAIQKKNVSSFSSVPRSCDFMTDRNRTSSTLFSGISDWPRTIVWGGKDKTCNVWKLINPKGSQCVPLHRIKMKAQIGVCKFSPDATLMCFGSYGGILKIYETESGVLVQTFKDNIRHGEHGGGGGGGGGGNNNSSKAVGGNNPVEQEHDATKITRITVVTDDSKKEDNEDNSMFGLPGILGGSADNTAALKKSASCKCSVICIIVLVSLHLFFKLQTSNFNYSIDSCVD